MGRRPDKLNATYLRSHLMSIEFSCPSCGVSTTVEAKYAGQTGPCRSCGENITIPGQPTLVGSAAEFHAPRKKSSAGVWAITCAVRLARRPRNSRGSAVASRSTGSIRGAAEQLHEQPKTNRAGSTELRIRLRPLSSSVHYRCGRKPHA